MFSNGAAQFLEVIKLISSRTCFLAYDPKLGYSRQNPNTGCWGHAFLKKAPGIFRFVILPLKIPDKMKFQWKKWNSTKLCYTHWNFQDQKPIPMEIPHYFFLDHAWKFHLLFYWRLEFPHSIFSIPLKIPYPQTHPCPYYHCSFF